MDLKDDLTRNELNNLIQQLLSLQGTQEKPFWNNELQMLWKLLNQCEKEYLKSPQFSNLRKVKHSTYIQTRQAFDRMYKREKRKYNRSLQDKIEKINTENPRDFWRHIKTLGPGNKNDTIPMEAYDKNEIGDTFINCSKNYVLNHWADEFEKLFNKPNFEINNIIQAIINDLHYMEAGINYDDNSGININIEVGDVQKVIKKSKNGKAVGPDNLPYEIFKNEAQ